MLLYTENLKANLSTKQIIAVLNGLLNAAVEPLFEHSSLMRQFVLQAMLQTQEDHRRKISIHNKETTAALVIAGVVNHDYSAIKLCEIDRGMLFHALDHLHSHLQQALDVEQQLVRRPRSVELLLEQTKLAKYLGIDSNLLTPLARWIAPYYSLYRDFKELITAKYIKFAYQQANNARMLTGLSVDIDDLFKNYLLAVDKALDKCDANQGTLTAYIQKWMLSAKTSPDFGHQYEVAFSLPANVRKEMDRLGIPLLNRSSIITEAHHEIMDDESLDRMQQNLNQDTVLIDCLRHVPDSKVVYLMLGLPFNLQNAELANLHGEQLQ